MDRQIKVQLIFSLLPVIVSSIISYVISTNRMKVDTANQITLKESNLLNKIVEISEEGEPVIVDFINRKRVVEVHITTYMDSENKVLFNDTSYYDHPVRDTMRYIIPKFLYDAKSNELVRADIIYIKEHMDDLGLETYGKVKDFIDFIEDHPIDMLSNDFVGIDENEWATGGVYPEFCDKAKIIKTDYLKRLRKLGLSYD